MLDSTKVRASPLTTITTTMLLPLCYIIVIFTCYYSSNLPYKLCLHMAYECKICILLSDLGWRECIYFIFIFLNVCHVSFSYFLLLLLHIVLITVRILLHNCLYFISML